MWYILSAQQNYYLIKYFKIVIKNIVRIARGEGTVGRGVYRSYYKGHKDKIKGEVRGGGGRWDWLGWGGGMGRKCRQL